MRTHPALLIALAIIIGAGDRLIDSIEGGKRPVVIAISGLVGAAIAVKFLLENRPQRDEPQEPTKPRSMEASIVDGVREAAEQAVAETIEKEVARVVSPKKRPPPDA
jgi:hypothetical protein